MQRPPGTSRNTPPAPGWRTDVTIGQTLLAVVAVILVGSTLRATAPVTLPLAFALFLVAVFWPLQRMLERRMSAGPAVLLTLTVFLLIVGLLVGALWFSAEQIVERAPRYADAFRQYVRQLQSLLERHGLSLPADGPAFAGASDRLLVGFGRGAFALLGGFVLIVAFLVLGLLEVPDYQRKMSRVFHEGDRRRWLDPLHRITDDFLRYIAVRTVLGLINGAAVWLFALAIGLDFAFVWGLSSFLLNYIPTLGSIVATFPPALFALVQYQSAASAFLVLLAVSAIQLVLGNYVDPRLQGKYLALSPLVVLLSITFWGWMWGIAGAFIGIPITVATVITCRQFARTRWIATLLADVDEEEEERAKKPG